MNGIIMFIGGVLILFIGRPIFVPLVFSVFLWYLANAIASYYRRVLPYKKSTAAGVIAIGAAIATMVALIALFATHIRPAFAGLMSRLPELQLQLKTLADWMGHQTGFDFDASAYLPNLQSVAQSVAGGIMGAGTTIGLILVYVLFMFVEQSTFSKKFAATFPAKKQYHKMKFIFDSINANMKKYLFVKTFISIATAVTSYACMKYLGVEFAGIWAFIIFVLNYIPTFGSIVACALPILYSLITAATLATPVMLAVALIGLQILFSNILEPRITGKTLNLSTLAILINLVFWGMLWGPAGMFFSVPMLVATFVVTAQFDETRWIAVLLSADGEIPDKEED